jgi:predicted DNA-binding transcriptional regulator YafY
LNQTERIFKIEQMITARRVVPFNDLLAELEVSRATLKRDLEYLRSRMRTPIVYDRQAGGYVMQAQLGSSTRVEFPGLWFNASEAAALLTMHHLLEQMQPGLLKRQIEPLKSRLEALLERGNYPLSEVQHRVRMVTFGRRAPEPKCFSLVASGLLDRRRLKLNYYSRSTGERSERTVSPQRLVCYRQSWYLDAWCHMRNGLRSFAADCIERADITDEAAKEISDEVLDAELAESYGIFAGRAKAHARLRFSAERARWVAHEIWHPDQRGAFQPDGTYLLEFPYGDDRELIGDILHHGADVEVIAPEDLRRKVAEAHQAAARLNR